MGLDFARGPGIFPNSRIRSVLTQSHTEPLSEGEDHHHLMVGGARLAERQVVILEAAGSNPVTHPKFGDSFIRP